MFDVIFLIIYFK